MAKPRKPISAPSAPPVFDDPEGNAPPLHESRPLSDNVPAGNHQPGRSATRAVARSVADAERYKKLEEAFAFAPVWHRFNAESQAWEDYALEGFSLMRRQLWWRLISNFCPLPASGYGRYSTATAFDGWAMLFICSHKFEAFVHLLGNPTRFIEAITAWAETSIPEEDWNEAVNLAWLMDEVAETTAVRLPTRPGRGSLGNAPSL